MNKDFLGTRMTPDEQAGVQVKAQAGAQATSRRYAGRSVHENEPRPAVPSCR